MVRQEILVQCLGLVVASMVAMTTALGDLSLLHPMGAAGGMLMADIDTPDTTFISSSPFLGGQLVQSVDLGDSYYALGGGIGGGIGAGMGGGYRSPMMNQGLSMMPPRYNSYQRRRMSYPASRNYGGRSIRMRLVPV